MFKNQSLVLEKFIFARRAEKSKDMLFLTVKKVHFYIDLQKNFDIHIYSKIDNFSEHIIYNLFYYLLQFNFSYIF